MEVKEGSTTHVTYPYYTKDGAKIPYYNRYTAAQNATAGTPFLLVGGGDVTAAVADINASGPRATQNVIKYNISNVSVNDTITGDQKESVTVTVSSSNITAITLPTTKGWSTSVVLTGTWNGGTRTEHLPVTLSGTTITEFDLTTINRTTDSTGNSLPAWETGTYTLSRSYTVLDDAEVGEPFRISLDGTTALTWGAFTDAVADISNITLADYITYDENVSVGEVIMGTTEHYYNVSDAKMFVTMSNEATATTLNDDEYDSILVSGFAANSKAQIGPRGEIMLDADVPLEVQTIDFRFKTDVPLSSEFKFKGFAEKIDGAWIESDSLNADLEFEFDTKITFGPEGRMTQSDESSMRDDIKIPIVWEQDRHLAKKTVTGYGYEKSDYFSWETPEYYAARIPRVGAVWMKANKKKTKEARDEAKWKTSDNSIVGETISTPVGAFRSLKSMQWHWVQTQNSCLNTMTGDVNIKEYRVKEWKKTATGDVTGFILDGEQSAFAQGWKPSKQPRAQLVNTLWGDDPFWNIPWKYRAQLAWGEPYKKDNEEIHKHRRYWAQLPAVVGGLSVGHGGYRKDLTDDQKNKEWMTNAKSFKPYHNYGTKDRWGDGYDSDYEYLVDIGRRNIGESDDALPLRIQNRGWMGAGFIDDNWPKAGMVAVSPFHGIVPTYNDGKRYAFSLSGEKDPTTGIEYMTYSGIRSYGWLTNGFGVALARSIDDGFNLFQWVYMNAYTDDSWYKGQKFNRENRELTNINRSQDFYPVRNDFSMFATDSPHYKSRGGDHIAQIGYHSEVFCVAKLFTRGDDSSTTPVAPTDEEIKRLSLFKADYSMDAGWSYTIDSNTMSWTDDGKAWFEPISELETGATWGTKEKDHNLTAFDDAVAEVFAKDAASVGSQFRISKTKGGALLTGEELRESVRSIAGIEVVEPTTVSDDATHVTYTREVKVNQSIGDAEGVVAINFNRDVGAAEQLARLLASVDGHQPETEVFFPTDTRNDFVEFFSYSGTGTDTYGGERHRYLTGVRRGLAGTGKWSGTQRLYDEDADEDDFVLPRTHFDTIFQGYHGHTHEMTVFWKSEIEFCGKINRRDDPEGDRKVNFQFWRPNQGTMHTKRTVYSALQTIKVLPTAKKSNIVVGDVVHYRDADLDVDVPVVVEKTIGDNAFEFRVASKSAIETNERLYINTLQTASTPNEDSELVSDQVTITQSDRNVRSLFWLHVPFTDFGTGNIHVSADSALSLDTQLLPYPLWFTTADEIRNVEGGLEEVSIPDWETVKPFLGATGPGTAYEWTWGGVLLGDGDEDVNNGYLDSHYKVGAMDSTGRSITVTNSGSTPTKCTIEFTDDKDAPGRGKIKIGGTSFEYEADEVEVKMLPLEDKTGFTYVPSDSIIAAVNVTFIGYIGMINIVWYVLIEDVSEVEVGMVFLSDTRNPPATVTSIDGNRYFSVMM